VASEPEQVTPTWVKQSHTSFSVSDAEASAAWLTRVLGVAEIDRVQSHGWKAIILVHRPSGTVLEYQQHDANQGERFDPRRTGLDHVGFLVADRAALDVWAQHFERLGVDYTPVADRDYGAVLTFRDPDGIQLEMFHRPDHP
jgi:glyoxylase I family protein